MARIDRKRNALMAKLVYYGPGLCGKTTNLEYINRDIVGNTQLVSLATEGDRTIFFDFMPLDLGKILGMDVKFKLYTVPGQVRYNQTRKMVLKNVDGVVFVADSQPSMLDANLESLSNLRDNLLELRIDPEEIPLVLQYNKRDLPQVMTVEEMNAELNEERRHPVFTASALSGDGVLMTLRAACKLVLRKVSAQLTGTRWSGQGMSATPTPPTAEPGAPQAVTGDSTQPLDVPSHALGSRNEARSVGTATTRVSPPPPAVLPPRVPAAARTAAPTVANGSGPPRTYAAAGPTSGTAATALATTLATEPTPAPPTPAPPTAWLDEIRRRDDELRERIAETIEQGQKTVAAITKIADAVSTCLTRLDKLTRSESEDLSSKVISIAGSVDALKGIVAAKADVQAVNTTLSLLSRKLDRGGRPATPEAGSAPAPDLDQQLQGLARKDDVASLQKVVDGLAKKADLASLEKSVGDLARKADLASLEKTVGGLARKADLASLERVVEGLPRKADLSALDGRIAGLARKSELDTLRSQVDGLATKQDLQALQAKLDALPGRAELETSLAAIMSALAQARRAPAAAEAGPAKAATVTTATRPAAPKAEANARAPQADAKPVTLKSGTAPDKRDKAEVDKPEVDKPEVDKPEARPKGDKAEADKPDAKPEGDKAEAAKPEADKRDKAEAAKPEADKRDKAEAAKPEADKPDAKPEADKLDAKPEADKPAADKPEADKPDAKPEADKLDANKPAADKPAADKPEADAEANKPEADAEANKPEADNTDAKPEATKADETPKQQTEEPDPYADDPRHRAAARTVRVMLSDLLLYHPKEVEEGVREDDFLERNKAALADIKETYESRVPAEIRAQRDHLRVGIDNLIAKKRKELGL